MRGLYRTVSPGILPVESQKRFSRWDELCACLVVVELEIAFETKLLRHICENSVSARRKYGQEVAERLKARLADLRAATCVTDVIAGRPREVGSDHPNMVIDLTENTRLVICANHPTTPTLTSGAVDWRKVSRVRIVQIESDDV